MPAAQCAFVHCRNGTYQLPIWKQTFCEVHKCCYGICSCICDPPFTLIPFPTERKNPEARKRWIRIVNRADPLTGKNWVPNVASRICSKHFIDSFPTDKHPYPSEDLGYQLSGNISVRRTIKKFSPVKRKRRLTFSEDEPVAKMVCADKEISSEPPLEEKITVLLAVLMPLYNAMCKACAIRCWRMTKM